MSSASLERKVSSAAPSRVASAAVIAAEEPSGYVHPQRERKPAVSFEEQYAASLLRLCPAGVIHALAPPRKKTKKPSAAAEAKKKEQEAKKLAKQKAKDAAKKKAEKAKLAAKKQKEKEKAAKLKLKLKLKAAADKKKKAALAKKKKAVSLKKKAAPKTKKAAAPTKAKAAPKAKTAKAKAAPKAAAKKATPLAKSGGVADTSFTVTVGGAALSRQESNASLILARTGSATSKWQYLADNGKWQDYDKDASLAVETAHAHWLLNPHVDVRSVKSGFFEYMVDFNMMQQQNIKHEAHKIRKIQRVAL